MIIQKKDGSLVDAQTSAKWTLLPYPGDGDDDDMIAVLLGPPMGRERILYRGLGADCRAFLDALAIEINAVRWNPIGRCFEPVGAGTDDG